MDVYDYPMYYEIAFSYQEVKKQVDLFETVVRKFGKKSIRRFLDIGCGTSPQLREIARRGYGAVGLDINPKMLQYLRQMAAKEGLKVETVQADMKDFKLKKKCDFAFCLSGSLAVSSNQEFLKHLECVAKALSPEGIYLLENTALDLKPFGYQDWTMKKDQIEIKATFEMKMIDPMMQISEGILTLEVNDRGERKKLVSIEATKDFAPQELKTIVELDGHFRFLGFFKHLSLEPLQQPTDSNMILMQKIAL